MTPEERLKRIAEIICESANRALKYHKNITYQRNLDFMTPEELEEIHNIATQIEESKPEKLGEEHH